MLKDLEMGELEERIYKLEEAIKFAMKATVSKTIRDKCKEALESNKSN